MQALTLPDVDRTICCWTPFTFRAFTRHSCICFPLHQFYAILHTINMKYHMMTYGNICLYFC